MTIYIAGPMTGIDQENLHAFLEAKEFFEAKGFEVIIPHDIAKEHQELEYGGLLAYDIFTIGTKCQAVAMLPGWSNSRGAIVEYTFARATNRVVLNATNGFPIPFGYSQNNRVSIVDDSSLDELIENCKILLNGKQRHDNEAILVEANCSAGITVAHQ